MNSSKNFVDACLTGECDLDAIDDFIDDWHDSDSELSIWQFLGMTYDEYGTWVIDPAVLPLIIEARRLNRPFVRPERAPRSDAEALR